MCGNYWIPFREKLIDKYKQLMIEEALNNKYNVIVDDTNLNSKTIQNLEKIANKFNANIKYKEFIISYKEAVKRDQNRDLKIGEDAIRMFYRKYYSNMLQTELNEL